MAVSTRIIRRRIKSIGNTKKITKAMELVSASKMRRAVAATLATRPYATLGWETVGEVAKVTDAGLHPLLRQAEKIERALVVFVTSDRGLCGGFNAQMSKRVIEFVKNLRSSALLSASVRFDGPVEAEEHRTATRMNAEVDVVTVGKKGTDLARRLGWNIVATFNNLSNNPSILDVRPVAQLAINDFIAGKYDIVYLAYTDFISSIRQVPNVKQLLPLTTQSVISTEAQRSGEISRGANEQGVRSLDSGLPRQASARDDKVGVGRYSHDYLFEPTPIEVLDGMLPRLVEVQVYQAILESSASEHSARMVAMKNASDSARDMIDDLTFTFNQARQATITREIAEISAGKAALE